MTKKYTAQDRNSDLRTVLAHGGIVTDEYERLNERLEAFMDETSYVNRLVDAVTGNTEQAELDTLRALALAQTAATPVDRANVTNQVKAAIARLQSAEVDRVALANYNHIRGAFNEAAERFTKAHSVVPADTDPAQLALAPEKTRKAWAEAQALQGTLDQLVPAILAAARLAGRTEVDNSHALGFVVNADGLHRRRIWEAWAADSKWTALLTAGATLTVPPLEDYQPYREPAPIETQYERTDMGLKPVTVDPEDEPDQHAPKRIRNAMASL